MLDFFRFFYMIEYQVLTCYEPMYFNNKWKLDMKVPTWELNLLLP